MKTIILTTIVLTLLINISAVAQVLTDDGLYAKGFTAVQYQNWPVASAYLFAYIQRNPVAFVQDKNYEGKVIYAYNVSINNIENEKSELRNALARKNEYISSLESRLNIPASLSLGLSSSPEIPPLDEPVQQLMKKGSKYSTLSRPIEGQWQATLSSSSGSVFTGTLTIVINVDVVTGTFTLSDNSASKVTGIFDGENLVLLRNTGATTIQSYAMKYIDENHYSGSYKNEGRYPDDGRIDLMR